MMSFKYFFSEDNPSTLPDNRGLFDYLIQIYWFKRRYPKLLLPYTSYFYYCQCLVSLLVLTCFFLIMSCSSTDIRNILWIFHFFGILSLKVYLLTRCNTQNGSKNLPFSFWFYLILIYLLFNQILSTSL